MALLDLSAWSEAAEDARGRPPRAGAPCGERDAALASISAASSARWSLGQHDARPARCSQDHLARQPRPRPPPSAARAEALTQAAGMAVHDLALRARRWRLARRGARRRRAPAEADEIATRALIFMGMAESGRGGHGGPAAPGAGPPRGRGARAARASATRRSR